MEGSVPSETEEETAHRISASRSKAS
jgi:hypothetical protein